jgi:hypothetical protein
LPAGGSAAASLDGPWTYVAGDALPPDFARIPPTSLAGAVLAAVPGTAQARNAVVEAQIPQTATVPRSGGPRSRRNTTARRNSSTSRERKSRARSMHRCP